MLGFSILDLVGKLIINFNNFRFFKFQIFDNQVFELKINIINLPNI